MAIDSPVPALDRPFDYAIPDRLIGRVAVGSVVRVVLHGRGMRAFVTDLLDEPEVPNPRPLRSVVAREPLFGPAELTLARWAARRYVVPLGLVLHEAVPGRFSAPRGAPRLLRAPARSQLIGGAPRPAGAAPPEPPASLGEGIADSVAKRSSALVLPPDLRSEPELAAHVAAEAAGREGRTLVICPRVEIAEIVAARIDGAIVMHGAERPRERAEAWAAARDGAANVVVGGRSALFAPIPGLAAVCVLSAHDRSLKSERAPRLHALVVARERARMSEAAFVASSPAPPLEVAADDGTNWIEGGRGRVRAELARPRGEPVTPRLLEVVRSTIRAGMNALVFVARRGGGLRLRCKDCGWTPLCPRCGVALAEGEAPNLVCRMCGEMTAAPDACSQCGGALASRGWGHERVARALERADVVAPVVRIVGGRVPAVGTSPAVYVGTLAAAYAVRSVGCVCVADLDQLLGRPDFRAGERALQVLHELAAVLSGGGRYLIQTWEPEHHAVQAFTRQSYRYFFDRELAIRREAGYPPFGVVLRVEVPESDIGELGALVQAAGGNVIGAVPRRGLMGALVRAPSLEPLLDPLRTFSASHARSRIDVDPVDVI